ncbi:GNAT family N-acetyltransferase [Marinomonas sp. 2405UD68-3]|uniref:GNAT family N-acetyltransferase n=1 Tax=Marinomonas sp. 2405UD68-3 TaxID=3391835 RepID=UPI0039C9E284
MHAAQQHRYFYILIGSIEARLNAFQALSANLHSPIVTSTHSLPFYSSTEETLNLPIYYPFKKLPLLLGQTNEAILFDVEDGICSNSFAIASGTVKGGGLFAIGLPDTVHWLKKPDQELAKYLPWPLTVESATSYFKHYFLHELMSLPHCNMNNSQAVMIVRLNSNTKLTPLDRISSKTYQDFLLTEQQQHNLNLTKEHLTKNKKAAVMMTAHRGRGKSTLLGVMIAELASQNWNIAVTAPRKEAIRTLNMHYETHQSQNTPLPFFPADQLILYPVALDCLVVDEAAAFPIPVLEKLLSIYPKIVFSSTNHGYEIGGRGFGIRFLNSIKQSNIPLLECTLEQPVRWKDHDPLEQWVDQLLFLYPNSDNEEQTNITDKTLSVQSNQWLESMHFLRLGFRLLVSAHYQTSPNDIRWLMDDPSVSTWFRFASSKLISIAVVTQEGPIDNDLIQPILEGIRRPRGHLLPQSLLAHEGWLSAADFSYWRISRIATDIAHQRQGGASQLLSDIEVAAKKQNIDILCTSFSAQPELIKFWQKNGFHVVRLGNSKDQASGSYSVMMVKGLSHLTQMQTIEWHGNFQDNFYITSLLGQQSLSSQLIMALLKVTTKAEQELHYFREEKDKQDIALFIERHRPLSSIQPQLTRFLIHIMKQGKLDFTLPSHLILCDLAFGRISENTHPFQSKKHLLQSIKERLAEAIKRV